MTQEMMNPQIASQPSAGAEGMPITVDGIGQVGPDMGPPPMQPGDLVLMTPLAGAQASHVAVFMGEGHVIEVQDGSAVIRPLAEALGDDTAAAVCRRIGLTQAHFDPLVRWLKTQEGRPYGSPDGTGIMPSGAQSWFCSDMVLAAFANIGLPLTEGAGAAMLPGTPTLLTTVGYVGHAKHPARPEPVASPQGWALGPFTPTEAERDAMIPSGSYGQTVDAGILETGDLIVVSADHILSEAIRQRTGSPASHIALYIGEGEVIEAIASGVEKRSLGTVLSETHYAAAYRYSGLSSAEKTAIRNFAIGEWRRGASYDFRAIASLQHMQDDDAWFCSELVFAAYDAAGIRLGDSALSTPGQVINMTGVEYLGHLPAQGDSTMSLSQTRSRRHTRARSLQGGAALAELGFEITKSVVTGSAGDITFSFDRLDGKYSQRHGTWSAAERQAHDAPAHPYTPVQLESRQSYWDLGTISAAVPISFEYNGHYIANLRLGRPRTDEHFAYGMDIGGEITHNPNLFRTTGGDLVSRVDLRITHVIDYDFLGESFYDDTAEIMEHYRIYSDGSVWCTVVVDGTWWFDAGDGQAPFSIRNGNLHVEGPHSMMVEIIRQQLASQSQALSVNASYDIPGGQSVHWESAPFRVRGSGSEPTRTNDPAALVASHRRGHGRALSSDRIETAVRVAMDNGATEDEARAFFAHEASVRRRRGTAARLMEAGTRFPAISFVGPDGWLVGTLDQVIGRALPASANPLQIIFDFCTSNNLTIGLGILGGAGWVDAADAGFGVVVAPGNRIGYYGAVSVGIGWNFEASGGVQLTVIEGGPSVFAGTSLVVGGSIDLSEGPSVGFRVISNTSGAVIGWTGEVTVSLGVPGFSAVEFTSSVQQTHARFTRVRTQSLGYAASLSASGERMIGGLPLRRAKPGIAPNAQVQGWAMRGAVRRDAPRRIWA